MSLTFCLNALLSDYRAKWLAKFVCMLNKRYLASYFIFNS
jgi:hypothetical protein